MNGEKNKTQNLNLLHGYKIETELDRRLLVGLFGDAEQRPLDDNFVSARPDRQPHQVSSPEQQMIDMAILTKRTDDDAGAAPPDSER